MRPSVSEVEKASRKEGNSEYTAVTSRSLAQWDKLEECHTRHLLGPPGPLCPPHLTKMTPEDKLESFESFLLQYE